MPLLLLCGQFVVWSSATNGSISSLNHPSNESCSDQIGSKPRWLFKQSSCFMCLKYMFPSTSAALNFSLLNVNDSESVDAACAKVLHGHSDFVSALSDCRRRVIKCCNAALACCNSQLQWRQEQNTRKHVKENDFPPESFCPVTWDGLLCFNASRNGTMVRGVCPSYSPNFSNKSKLSSLVLNRHGYFNCHGVILTHGANKSVQFCAIFSNLSRLSPF